MALIIPMVGGIQWSSTRWPSLAPWRFSMVIQMVVQSMESSTSAATVAFHGLHWLTLAYSGLRWPTVAYSGPTPRAAPSGKNWSIISSSLYDALSYNILVAILWSPYSSSSTATWSFTCPAPPFCATAHLPVWDGTKMHRSAFEWAQCFALIIWWLCHLPSTQFRALIGTSRRPTPGLAHQKYFDSQN